MVKNRKEGIKDEKNVNEKFRKEKKKGIRYLLVLFFNRLISVILASPVCLSQPHMFMFSSGTHSTLVETITQDHLEFIRTPLEGVTQLTCRVGEIDEWLSGISHYR